MPKFGWNRYGATQVFEDGVSPDESAGWESHEPAPKSEEREEFRRAPRSAHVAAQRTEIPEILDTEALSASFATSGPDDPDGDGRYGLVGEPPSPYAAPATPAAAAAVGAQRSGSGGGSGRGGLSAGSWKASAKKKNPDSFAPVQRWQPAPSESGNIPLPGMEGTSISEGAVCDRNSGSAPWRTSEGEGSAFNSGTEPAGFSSEGAAAERTSESPGPRRAGAPAEAPSGAKSPAEEREASSESGSDFESDGEGVGEADDFGEPREEKQRPARAWAEISAGDDDSPVRGAAKAGKPSSDSQADLHQKASAEDSSGSDPEIEGEDSSGSYPDPERARPKKTTREFRPNRAVDDVTSSASGSGEEKSSEKSSLFDRVLSAPRFAPIDWAAVEIPPGFGAGSPTGGKEGPPALGFADEEDSSAETSEESRPWDSESGEDEINWDVEDDEASEEESAGEPQAPQNDSLAECDVEYDVEYDPQPNAAGDEAVKTVPENENLPVATVPEHHPAGESETSAPIAASKAEFLTGPEPKVQPSPYKAKKAGILSSRKIQLAPALAVALPRDDFATGSGR